MISSDRGLALGSGTGYWCGLDVQDLHVHEEESTHPFPGDEAVLCISPCGPVSQDGFVLQERSYVLGGRSLACLLSPVLQRGLAASPALGTGRILSHCPPIGT